MSELEVSNNWSERQINGYKNDLEYLTEKIILEFTEKISEVLVARKINRKDLQRKVGFSITKMLDGDINYFSLENMVKVANVLNMSLDINLLDEKGE